jgi:2-polyprenyl-3-methyl-5-hydroxy-6-metoxy-1,4-benzoquinol methylase
VKDILATDISSKMVEIAKSKAAAENVDNVTFQVGALEDLDIPEHSVDAVLGLSILHLLENRETAIRNVHKFLKPGGIFVSSTACLGDKMKWFGLIGPIGCALGLIPLVRVFSRSELEHSLTAAGFELDRVWQPDKGIAVFIVARA